MDAASLLLSACVDVHDFLPACSTTPLASPLRPADPRLDTTVMGCEPGETPPAPPTLPPPKSAQQQQLLATAAGGPAPRTYPPAMSPEDVIGLLNDNGLQLYHLTPAKVPFVPGWQGACSGRYRLDVSRQVGKEGLGALCKGMSHMRSPALLLLCCKQACIPDASQHAKSGVQVMSQSPDPHLPHPTHTTETAPCP